jgi:NADH-quinone oxidoreductase subunit G
MAKVFIDDHEIEVPDGSNMIQAAKLAGIEIPHFCYHPGLGVDGNCRLCLIEIDGVPKPQIACNTFAKDGLKIKTNSERVHELRRAVLEFFFLNHPLVCPICDQSGECLLQDFYQRHGQYESRLDLPKVHKRKVAEIGPRVVLDAERCVLCARCVRFCDQVPKTGELRIVNRGNHSEIAVHPDRPLDNPYSINTVDICPVGALTSVDFRFKCRVWFLSTANSICTGCSRGCNIYLEHNEGTVHRYRPRENQDVNKWWMCDDGRLSYKKLNDDRCEAPLLNGEETTHSEALGATVAALAACADPSAIAVVLSPEMSNESLYAMKRFAADVLGARRVVAGSLEPPAVEDAILRRPEAHPNRRGCEILGLWTADPRAELAKGGSVAIVVQNDLVECDQTVAGLLDTFATVIVLATNVGATTAAAKIVLPVTPHSETDGTFTNFEGRVQRFRKAMTPHGDALAVMELCKRIAAGLGKEFGWVNLNQIWKEMAAEISEFAGMSPQTLGDQGMGARSAGSAGTAGTKG